MTSQRHFLNWCPLSDSTDSEIHNVGNFSLFCEEKKNVYKRAKLLFLAEKNRRQIRDEK